METDVRLAVIVAALLGIFVMLFWMAYLDDRRAARRREEQMQKRLDVWVRSQNPTTRAYEAWLNEQDIATWPYEPSAGYDERKEQSA